jgi:hypothetical protein
MLAVTNRRTDNWNFDTEPVSTNRDGNETR